MGNLITTSTTTETNVGTKWRKKAQEFNTLRSTCFEKSQNAFHKGDHTKAKEWSTKGKQYGLKMDEANEKAAKAIFDSLNTKGKHPVRTYDFHGLYVKEALKKLEEIVKFAKRQKWSDVTIIVGRGNNSLNGVAKV